MAATEAKEQHYAYVTLVMRGTKYMPGAKAWVQSLVDAGTLHDIIVMVTKDVPFKDRDELDALGALVLEVPYIKHDRVHGVALHEKLYGDWMDQCFTKFNMLRPNIFDANHAYRNYEGRVGDASVADGTHLPFKYDKILFMDADTVAIENIDHLFALPAPAGVFTSPADDAVFTHHCKYTPELRAKSHLPLYNPYRDHRTGATPAHGSVIKREQIIEGLTDKRGSFVASGHCILVEPSAGVWNHFIEMMKDTRPYGHVGCISGADEQFAMDLFPTDWCHIHSRYNAVAGKFSYTEDKIPAVMHYIAKPWDENIFKCKDNRRPMEHASDDGTVGSVTWTDFSVWWHFAKKIGIKSASVMPDALMNPKQFKIWYFMQMNEPKKFRTMYVGEFLNWLKARDMKKLLMSAERAGCTSP